MKPGYLVRVLGIVDADDLRGPEGGQVNCERFVGKVGVVRGVAFSGMGVGESAKDPALLVEVPGLGRDLFWTEEVRKVRKPR
jgi:hypothetical protein